MIRSTEVSTQEDLVTKLNQSGLDVTQATISRDIKELGIIKITGASGQQKYRPMEQNGEVAAVRLLKVFSEAVVNIDHAMNLVVLKTLPGMAQASASALDALRLTDIVGTIAGDDTIFVATRTPSTAAVLAETLRRVRNKEETALR
jgi:transcriptional regulator of arginine metabolism